MKTTTEKLALFFVSRQNGPCPEMTKTSFVFHDSSWASPGPFSFWWNTFPNQFWSDVYHNSKSKADSFGKRFAFDGRLCDIAGWTAMGGFRANFVAVRKIVSYKDLSDLNPKETDKVLGDWYLHGRMSPRDAELLVSKRFDEDIVYFDNSEIVKSRGLDPYGWDFNAQNAKSN